MLKKKYSALYFATKQCAICLSTEPTIKSFL